MANRYWAAGVSGNWNDTASWSSSATGTPAGASVPGSSDAAIFNAASGTVTATLDISPTVQTLTMTGFTGTLAFGTNTISLNSTGTVFTGATTMTVTGTPLIILNNNTASARTVTPTAVTEANSISFRIISGTGSMVVTAGTVRDLDFTNGTNPTGFAGNVTNTAITIYGNFKASTSGMTRTAGTQTYTFAATSGTKTITTAAVVFDNPFTFNGVGGAWQLQDALTSGSTRTCTLTNGTLDLNNFTLTTGLFSSTNTNTRTLAFGTGKIVITGNNATVCSTNTGTGLTVTGSKRVELAYSGSVGTRAISGPQTATIVEGTNLLNYYVTAGTDIVTFSGARGYGDIDFSNGGTSTFTTPGNLTNGAMRLYGDLILNSTMVVGSGSSTVQFFATSGTKTITSAGQTLDFPLTISGLGGTFAFSDALTLGATQPLTFANGTLRLAAGTTNTVGSFVTTGTTLKYLQSTIPGTQATISDASGTDTVTYLSIQDSNATGGATWDATSSTNFNAGNNTGWRFTILAALSGLLATGSVQTIFGFGWGAIPDTSESWGAIPDTSETWTVIGNTSETWTPISSTS
jgi:hypothetical protein